jgi:membrane fusion protein, heavy metal efflux system
MWGFPMRRSDQAVTTLVVAGVLLFSGCGGTDKTDARAEAPPPVQVEHETDLNIVRADHPEQFPLTTAISHDARPELVVTGVVSPDVSRNVPVISLAAGRVVEILARLGDTVKKGQLLMRVQSADVSAAFSDYRKALADEILARTQFDRAKDLYAHGALSLNDVQVAQDAEDKAKVDVETTAERLRLIGNDPSHPTGIVDIYAPVSGIITDQQVTNAAGVQGLSSPNPFTISDLSHVWIVCDVHENDLPNVRLGETADIRLNAYQDQDVKGMISNIGAILDANTRTAKVRIEVRNPGFMRPGMFATATFHGLKQEVHAAVPASAILHLHDRDWVYVPDGEKQFRRVEVIAGAALPNNSEEIISGIRPGQKVVINSLVLESTVEQ